MGSDGAGAHLPGVLAAWNEYVPAETVVIAIAGSSAWGSVQWLCGSHSRPGEIVAMAIKPAAAAKPRTCILPPAPYAAALVGGWWLDRHMLKMTLDLGSATWPAGLAAIALGLTLFGWTLFTFWQHQTTVNPYRGATSLCTGGPFAFSRNPIYLGDWFLLFGASVLFRTAWPLESPRESQSLLRL